MPNNLVENPKSLLRRVRLRILPPQVTLAVAEPVNYVLSTSNSMAEKTLREFSIPSAADVPVGPTIGTRNGNFEIKTGVITMVQASPFCGKTNEDANAHLQHFLELCSTITI